MTLAVLDSQLCLRYRIIRVSNRLTESGQFKEAYLAPRSSPGTPIRNSVSHNLPFPIRLGLVSPYLKERVNSEVKSDISRQQAVSRAGLADFFTESWQENRVIAKGVPSPVRVA